jgi:hypothetical protein
VAVKAAVTKQSGLTRAVKGDVSLEPRDHPYMFGDGNSSVGDLVGFGPDPDPTSKDRPDPIQNWIWFYFRKCFRINSIYIIYSKNFHMMSIS